MKPQGLIDPNKIKAMKLPQVNLKKLEFKASVKLQRLHAVEQTMSDFNLPYDREELTNQRNHANKVITIVKELLQK